MALPWELVEEILSRVPPKSLVRFKIVCKRWNSLFDDKAFINNHKKTFGFILTTKSKIYLVSINPEIEVRELTLDIPGLESQIPENLVDCNELVLCEMKNGTAVWNPSLRKSTWFEHDSKETRMQLKGIGYENGSYKMFASFLQKEDHTKSIWKTYDFASGEWNYYSSESRVDSTAGQKHGICSLLTTSVSLNGTLYWAGYFDMANDTLVIMRFHFSRRKFVRCCDLPCGRNHLRDALVLRVYKGDRFSLLKQCHTTKKIEIWVTKNKINNWDGEDVVWMNFMQVSSPNLPYLGRIGSYSRPSYFIEDKRLVMCSCDETGRAWIYVLGGNKLISKIQIASMVDPWPSHCTYTSSLVLVPSVQREEVELQV